MSTVRKAYAARPHLRVFTATVGETLARRHAGLDVKARDVVAALVDDYERHPDCRAGGKARRRHAETFPDLVVWEADRVVAVLRPSADGATLDVVRFDASEPVAVEPTAAV
jgi:hypothetical protein